MVLLKCQYLLLSLFISVGTAYALTPVSTDNFSEAFLRHSTLLVHFFSPTCSHCSEISIRLAWVSAGLQTDAQIGFYECDVTEPKSAQFVEQQGIIGYPVLKLYHSLDQVLQTNGLNYIAQNVPTNLTVEHLTEHLRLVSEAKTARTATIEISTMQSLKRLLLHGITVLGLFPGKDKNALLSSDFSSMAFENLHRNEFYFVHSFDVSLANTIQGTNCCKDQVLFISEREPTYQACATVDKAALQHCVNSFMAAHIVGVNSGSHHQQQVKQLLSQPGMVLLAIFRHEQLGQAGFPALGSLTLDGASLRILIVNATQHGRFLRNWNISSSQLPAMILYNTSTMASNVGTNLEAAAIQDWINQQVAAGVVGSQGGSCEVLEAALQSDAPVLLHLYVPWCAACKRAKEVLIQATAELAEQDPNSVLKVVHVDASLCALPALLQVRRFPSLFLVRPQSCEAVRFNDAISAQPVSLFWQQHAGALSGAVYVEGTPGDLAPGSCNSTVLKAVEATA